MADTPHRTSLATNCSGDDDVWEVVKEDGGDRVHLLGDHSTTFNGTLPCNDENDDAAGWRLEVQAWLTKKRLAEIRACEAQHEDNVLRAVFAHVKRGLQSGRLLVVERSRNQHSTLSCDHPFCPPSSKRVPPVAYVIVFRELRSPRYSERYCLGCLEELWNGSGLLSPLPDPNVQLTEEWVKEDQVHPLRSENLMLDGTAKQEVQSREGSQTYKSVHYSHDLCSSMRLPKANNHKAMRSNLAGETQKTDIGARATSKIAASASHTRSLITTMEDNIKAEKRVSNFCRKSEQILSILESGESTKIPSRRSRMKSGEYRNPRDAFGVPQTELFTEPVKYEIKSEAISTSKPTPQEPYANTMTQQTALSTGTRVKKQHEFTLQYASPIVSPPQLDGLADLLKTTAAAYAAVPESLRSSRHAPKPEELITISDNEETRFDKLAGYVRAGRSLNEVEKVAVEEWKKQSMARSQKNGGRR